MTVNAQRILQHCSHRSRFLVEVHPVLHSTNDTVKALARDGAPAGTVVFAEQQTGGRGRMGRSFFSPPGSGIYMTLLLRPQNAFRSATAVTTFAAVAVARAIERVTDYSPAIKWVNDIFLGGKKVSGILAEGAISPDGSGFDYIALGIGINVQKTAFPAELSNIATSLEAECGGAIDRDLLAAALLDALVPLLLGEIPHTAMEEYRRRSFVLGRALTVVVGDRSFPATAVRIEDDGNLIVAAEDGREERLFAGEVSLRI